MAAGTGRAAVLIAAPALAAATSEAVRAYPSEGCGVLLGRVAGGSAAKVWVARTVIVANAAAREGRYRIPARTLRGVESDAAAAGLEVVGFFHSHPDRPAEPSALDQENAWPWYAYLIVPVRDGRPEPATAWRLADDRRTFLEAPVTIVEKGDA